MSKKYVLNNLIFPEGDSLPRLTPSEGTGYSVAEYVRVAPQRTPGAIEQTPEENGSGCPAPDAPIAAPADYTVFDSAPPTDEVSAAEVIGPEHVVSTPEPPADPLQDVRASYEARLAENPGDVWALNNLAFLALRENDPVAALAYARQGLDVQCRLTETLFAALAFSVAQQGRSDEAHAIGRRGLDIHHALKALAADLPA